MSKSKIVEHLKNGVVVRAADGSTVHCAPLMLGDAMAIIDVWPKLQSSDAMEQLNAQMAIARILAHRYPQLREKISVGDVFKVLGPFFLRETTAMVVADSNGNGRTGTPSGASISPSGASVPT